MSWSNNNIAIETLETRKLQSATFPTAHLSFAAPAATTQPLVHATKAAAKAAAKPAPVIAEPAVTDSSIRYTSFSSNPLFSNAGPKADDVIQGYVGDCYFLSSLASIAKTNPALIKKDIKANTDGTFTVTFLRNGKAEAVVVDSKLPTWSNGQLAYAGTGAQGSLWVALYEKAYTVFRTHANSYASIDGGWMSDVFAAFGLKTSTTMSATTGTALLNSMKTDLKANREVTFAVGNNAKNAPVITNHAYTVVAVTTDAKGNPINVTLRNPWGVDGAGNDGKNDGYVTITAEQAKSVMLGEVTAWA